MSRAENFDNQIGNHIKALAETASIYEPGDVDGLITDRQLKTQDIKLDPLFEATATVAAEFFDPPHSALRGFIATRSGKNRNRKPYMLEQFNLKLYDSSGCLTGRAFPEAEQYCAVYDLRVTVKLALAEALSLNSRVQTNQMRRMCDEVHSFAVGRSSNGEQGYEFGMEYAFDTTHYLNRPYAPHPHP
ncbi:hypothetical protein Slin15195_G096140 [Septoria linicola]|uniref:Uncharacterized protein n=1 Tax=Septoria linicola TaxID=215465 RepID=A0A9Q9EMQ4_9PEZI|nr:hypothetical protein Slin14017_G059230 [Septoria linicola]USW56295.1 hypothetical protein Slin15195_G096140 [Septoria linicola]